MTIAHLWHLASSNNYVALEAGRYIAVALVAVFFKFRQYVMPHLPHRHTGYVSMNGSVWNCTTCGKPPADLEAELAKVRAEIAEHPWMAPYMGPDRAKYDSFGRERESSDA